MSAGEMINTNGNTDYVADMAEQIETGRRSVSTLTLTEIVSLREQYPHVSLEPKPEDLPVAWDAHLNEEEGASYAA